MALVQCTGCGGRVSDQAARCPSCGADPVAPRTVACPACGFPSASVGADCPECGSTVAAGINGAKAAASPQVPPEAQAASAGSRGHVAPRSQGGADSASTANAPPPPLASRESGKPANAVNSGRRRNLLIVALLAIAVVVQIAVFLGSRSGGSGEGDGTTSTAVTVGSQSPERDAALSATPTKETPKKRTGHRKLSKSEAKSLKKRHSVPGKLAHSVFRGPMGPHDDGTLLITSTEDRFLAWVFAEEGNFELLIRQSFSPWEIPAVLFDDTNGDGERDIVIMATYITGAGPQGSVPFNENAVFTWTGQGFGHDRVAESKVASLTTAKAIRKALR